MILLRWHLRRQAPRVALAAALCLACLAPWMVRNWMAFHHFVPMRSNFGAEFSMGNNPQLEDTVIGSPVRLWPMKRRCSTGWASCDTRSCGEEKRWRASGATRRRLRGSKVTANPAFTGSVSCRKCHEKFYQLWAPSHHGLAMQPYTADLARKNFPSEGRDLWGIPLSCGHRRKAGWVIERGPEGEKKYPDRSCNGRQERLLFPYHHGSRSAPDSTPGIRREQEGMVRHGCERGAALSGQTDEPIDWKDWQYTFNTACYGCHVSQVSTEL